MSMLIKGVDLPKDREFILLKVFPDGKTRIGLSTNYTQAIQIPTPHGRLIDGDELCNEFSNRCPGDCGCCGESRDDIYDCGLIINAPAILEAEE